MSPGAFGESKGFCLLTRAAAGPIVVKSGVSVVNDDEPRLSATDRPRLSFRLTAQRVQALGEWVGFGEVYGTRQRALRPHRLPCN